MVTVEDRSRRVLESKLKIESPFELDETLCLYSPQDNVDALTHPRIAEWLDYIQNDYEPELPEAEHREDQQRDDRRLRHRVAERRAHGNRNGRRLVVLANQR